MAKQGIGAVFAVGFGVAAASGAAAAVERSIPPPKQFSLSADRFDKSSFQGRFATMLSNCDPSSLFKPSQAVVDAVALLNDFQVAEDKTRFDQDALWAARKLKESAVHPDTNEIIPPPFRMSGYVPFNGPICVSMMMSTSTPALLFWNWINQSQNALVNYFNRNASSPTSNETLAMSYCGAVGAAITVAFGLSQLIKRKYDPATANRLLKFVAFPSSVVASSSNCYIMRSPEIDTGVELMDENMNVVADGKRSSAAANKAVMETVASRALLQIPVFFLPAVFMVSPPVASYLAASPAMALPLSTLVTILSFGIGLPATVAIFPQYGEISAEDVEPEFVGVCGADGQPLKTFVYNKGL